MKWNEIGIFFKKVVSSRTLWISTSGLTIFGVFAYMLLLTGVTINTSGDIYCGDTCEVYVNVTSTYWKICFNDTNFAPLYFDKQPIDYSVYVPARGANNWRLLQAGDCIERITKATPNPSRFKIIVNKKPFETIKYGIKVGNADVDPFLFADSIIDINGTKYNKTCNPVYGYVTKNETYECNETIQIKTYKNLTFYRIVPYSIKCKTPILKLNDTDWCNESYEIEYTYIEDKVILSNCTRLIKVYEQTDCKENGTVIVNNSKEVKVDRFFCGVDPTSKTKQYIVCDEYIDTHKGGGDGNGDGICQSGETCLRPKY